ncbi:23S rRNA (uracil(1939)-C(5))-methyltransferase RlmD [Ectothiorhodospiraceae bacterium BW-2]|nr:23S rRNA (uracil(1939)-C(5))-methyltransferase RlmD [Ectothiorhodospiraceae bacterium BW-2]
MARKRARQRLQQLDPVRVTIDSLSHDGRGVATVEGKKIFVEDALPQEQVTFRYVESRRSYDVGRAEAILTASPQRVEPRCSAFGRCGGCVLQHLKPAAQIDFKQQQLLSNLTRIGKVAAVEVAPPLLGPQWGYRHKARLGVRYVKARERVMIGFRERRSSFIADIDHCPVLHPSVAEQLPALAELIGSLDSFDRIAQLEVAVDESQTALVVRHLDPLSERDLQRLTDYAISHSLALYLQPKGPDSMTPLWPQTVVLKYQLPQFGVSYQFEPSDFTQVNPAINRLMVTQALDWLELQPQQRVLDLFCGLGNFTLALATQVAEVVGVEGSELLVERARENSALNRLDNVTFYAADLGGDNLAQQPWWQQRFDKVLLDPSRSGADRVLPHLAAMGVTTLLYVSCNPATLARDAGELVNRFGYRLQRVGVLDMFPHTAHVESMALFVKV